MSGEDMQMMGESAVQLVGQFFGDLTHAERELIPSVEKSDGVWIASTDEPILGIFFLNKTEQDRVQKYHDKGWPPFPGFMVGEGKKPAGAQVAIRISGACNIFSSNHTSNLIAFEVCPGASFTISDHFHEIKDASGQEFKYQVALAFVLAISEGEQWIEVKRRLFELLNHSAGVWGKLR